MFQQRIIKYSGKYRFCLTDIIECVPTRLPLGKDDFSIMAHVVFTKEFWDGYTNVRRDTANIVVEKALPSNINSDIKNS